MQRNRYGLQKTFPRDNLLVDKKCIRNFTMESNLQLQKRPTFHPGVVGLINMTHIDPTTQKKRPPKTKICVKQTQRIIANLKCKSQNTVSTMIPYTPTLTVNFCTRFAFNKQQTDAQHVFQSLLPLPGRVILYIYESLQRS